MSYDGVREDKMENYQNCFVSCCVTVVHNDTHTHNEQYLIMCFGFRLVFVRLFRFSFLCVFCSSLGYSVLVLLWPLCVIGQAIISLPCGFFFCLYI